MKKAIFFLLAALLLFLNCLPSSIVFADDSGYTDSQLSDIGTLMLTSLITSGEATELDFSDYTENSALDWLIAFGELAVTGDVSGLVDQGMSWLGGEIDEAYQNLIEDIRAWEHDVAPDLYNWWYNGSQYEYKLTGNNNISKPLKRLLEPNYDVPDISIGPNYEFIHNINDLYFGYNDHFIDYFNPPLGYWNNFGGNIYNFTTLTNLRNYTYLTQYYFDDFHNSTSNGIIDYSVINKIITINVYTTTQPITVSYTNYTSNDYILQSQAFGGYPADKLKNVWTSIQDEQKVDAICIGMGLYTPPIFTQNSFNTLYDALDYIYAHYCNINLYVDGQCWAYAGYDTTSPITIPGSYTILNNQPLIYNFSSPTYYDLNGLKTLITNAINNSDVLTWQDIDDYFLDINGQQAFPVVQIYRNDYDNMYIEQYPYPAKLIGMQQPLTFNEHMLDNYYGQYLTPMVDVASNTIDVIPGELKWVLGIGAILMIFAVIINRLLE